MIVRIKYITQFDSPTIEPMPGSSKVIGHRFDSVVEFAQKIGSLLDVMYNEFAAGSMENRDGL